MSGPRGICSSARDAPLSWRRPRNEPRSALVAGMRNRGEVAGRRAGWGGGEGGGRPPLGGKEREGAERNRDC